MRLLCTTAGTTKDSSLDSLMPLKPFRSPAGESEKYLYEISYFQSLGRRCAFFFMVISKEKIAHLYVKGN